MLRMDVALKKLVKGLGEDTISQSPLRKELRILGCMLNIVKILPKICIYHILYIPLHSLRRKQINLYGYEEIRYNH